MTIQVGTVISVHGTKIMLKIDEDSSKEALYFQGEKYKGVSIREYLSIRRGFREIICLVEGEHLDEGRFEGAGNYIRRVEVRPIGYFDQAGFHHGIKYLPMIKDQAFLLQEERIASIFEKGAESSGFKLGQMLKEELAVNLPWKRLFNGHIGIFGNTGSGKSNTLAKLYTVLFEQKLEAIRAKSSFVLLDFNGEYTGQQFVPSDLKVVYALSTQQRAGQPQAPRFPLASNEFWELESLSLLFQATSNTQRPFLNRVIEGRRRFETSPGSLTAYTRKKFRDAFCAGQCKAATLDLMRNVARILQNQPLAELLRSVSWYAKDSRFFRNRSFFDPDGVAYDREIAPAVEALDATQLDSFDQLILRVNLQLIGDLVSGYVQFEHIQPLLKRIESSLLGLRRVLDVGDESSPKKLLTVVSLRRCNNEMKKVLPLLFVKHYYNAQKDLVAAPPDKTLHFIVDEAHNILSEQSTRESESWKDYRLEQFEEIIKEGRKFGVFVTVASQRPADISPTIVSQLHNFFIHRLVNDRDLFLIDNTITTLDSLSRGLIPGLAQGSCVVTGTAFDLPMVLQIDRLAKEKQPASDDVNLDELWSEVDTKQPAEKDIQ